MVPPIKAVLAVHTKDSIFPINMLTRDQIKANIDAMQSQGASREDIQGWLDSLKTNQTTVPGSAPTATTITPSSPFGAKTPTTGVPNTTVSPAEPKGFIPSVVSAALPSIQKRGQNILEAAKGTATGASPTMGLSGPVQIVGNVAGAATDILGAGLKTAYQDLVPQKVKDSIASSLKVSAQDPVVQTATKALNQVASAWVDFANAHPEIAKDLKATGDIAGLLASAEAGIKGAGAVKDVAETLPTAAEGLATKAKSVLPTIKKDTTEQLVKDLTPELTPAKAAQAAQKGTDPMGLLKKGGLPVSTETAQTAEMIDSQFPEIAKAKTFGEKVNATKDAVAAYSKQTVEPFLDAHPAPFNKKTVSSVIDKSIQSNPLEFAPTQSGKNTYQVIKDEMMKAIDSNPQTLKGLWKARSQFDNAIESRYGAKFWDATDTSIRQATRNVRDAVNSYIDEKAGNSVFSNQMKTLNQLYNARDIFAEKFAKLEYGVSKAGQAGEKIKKAVKHLPVVRKAL